MVVSASYWQFCRKNRFPLSPSPTAAVIWTISSQNLSRGRGNGKPKQGLEGVCIAPGKCLQIFPVENGLLCFLSKFNGIDATAGGLVWVQRRNGSWWPGRIMGLDEISESCLGSDKAGTPIKLLGREDATVDWYNLETSRQVKAFRCGEYDDCIEKAKAFASHSSMKVVKYGRRENAILHALEIETAHESKDCQNSCSATDNSDSEPHGSWRKVSLSSDHSRDGDCIYDMTSSFEENSDSTQELPLSGVSYEETSEAFVPKGHPRKGGPQRTPDDSEDEGSDGIKRMRDLDDLGVGSERKVKFGGSTDSAPRVIVSLNTLRAVNCMSVGSLANGNRGKMPLISLKRKRSRVHVHRFLKRKHRQHTLTRVLDTLVTVPVIFDEFAYQGWSYLHGIYDRKVPGLESNESKQSLSLVMNNNSESTGVSYENENAVGHACDAAPYNKLKDGEISSGAPFSIVDSPENLFHVPLFIDDPFSAGCSPAFASSSLLRTHSDSFGGHTCRNCRADAVTFGNEMLNVSASASSPTSHSNNTAQKMKRGSSSEWQSKGKRNSRCLIKNEAPHSPTCLGLEDESIAFTSGTCLVDRFSPSSSANLVHQPIRSNSCADRTKTQSLNWYKRTSARDSRLLRYCHSDFTLHPGYKVPEASVSIYGDLVLYDVPVVVKACTGPHHVPYISMMSKLNSQAITGHPVPVQVLEGSEHCHFLMDSSGCKLNSKGTEVGCETKLTTENLILQSCRSPCQSPNTKKIRPASKKTRKLSSLTALDELAYIEGKPMILRRGPAITCVPLKVVFRRITVAMNGSKCPGYHPDVE
ncbi:hypothetical protein Nepgr_023910 [Nepenthes gracilis]|uniref:PWWP domain-containing protein n=1 Tax=Nepenthes gracilis TaxID=150966 RepID=A0AAD3T4V7_NEPGR|nr:hypothetical protein Nepgr_023910 [Nepenthes gracilis]